MRDRENHLLIGLNLIFFRSRRHRRAIVLKVYCQKISRSLIESASSRGVLCLLFLSSNVNEAYTEEEKHDLVCVMHKSSV